MGTACELMFFCLISLVQEDIHTKASLKMDLICDIDNNNNNKNSHFADEELCMVMVNFLMI